MTIRYLDKEKMNIVHDLIRNEFDAYAAEELRDSFEDVSVMVSYGENDPLGYAFATIRKLSEVRKESSIGLYVYPDHRGKGIGSKLIVELLERLETEKVTKILIDNFIMNHDASAFLEKHGFKMWYSSSLLEYGGKPGPEVDLNFTQYMDEDYYPMRAVCSEAFYEVRKTNNIEPYYIEPSEDEKKIILENRDQYHLTYDDDQVVGATKINGNCIDLIMVNKAYRNRGLGRKILQFSVNKILNQGHDTVVLCVMDTNAGARKLYEKFGFVIASTVQVYKRK